MYIVNRFRGFLPVVVDVETGGFNPQTDALLEVAIQIIVMQPNGQLTAGSIFSVNVWPFPNANINPAALEVNKINPTSPTRNAIHEKEALKSIFQPIRAELKRTGCNRAILVGHNPSFDLTFIKAASERNNIKRNPFHEFTTFDTATMSGIAYGETVLSKAVKAAKLDWNNEKAHSAVYDTERTAQLFCKITNKWGVVNL